MALTLIEAAKMVENPIQSGIIEHFARSTDILMALPFENINGNALRYNREQTLPGVGFRGVNEQYQESTGILNPVSEPLVIAGGDLDVDKFLIETMGAQVKTAQEFMKTKALSLAWGRAFIKGDSATNPRVFDGLQVRCTGNQLITTGNNNDGQPLSLTVLDQLIDQVENPTHIIMSKDMRRRLTQASRNSAVGGFITFTQDNWGRTVTQYNDLPVLIAGDDNVGNGVLAFDELNPAAVAPNAVTTSIYCVSLGSGMLTGIQSGPMRVHEIGELESAPASRTRIEWYSGVAVFHGKAAARLAGISNAAVVA